MLESCKTIFEWS